MMHRGNIRSLALAVAVALGASTSAYAQSAAITGRVTDARGETSLKGAVITIVELGRTTASDEQGFYRFSGLADGTYTLRVQYIGAEPAQETVILGEDEVVSRDLAVGENTARLDNVLVVGQAAGQAAALNRQRAATNIVNVVSSDAIGQLPDQNVTEALQRVPGISITRDQGEGRFVTVRGLDANLNAITINGARVPSAENDARQVALDVIPADLLESLEVTKSLRPDMDADAIGGSIEIKSLNAFDRGGRSASVRVEGSYNDLVEEWSPKATGTFTDIFDVGGGQLGVALSGSYFDREFGSDNLEVGDGWDRYEDENGGSGFGPLEAEQRDYLINRRRIGLALNLDYQPNLNNSFYLRTLYSDFEDDEQRRANIVTFEDGTPVDVTTNTGFFEGAEITREFRDRLETQTITSVALGGEHFFDAWRVDYQVSYSEAEEDEPGRVEAQFQNDFDVGYARRSESLFRITGDAAVFDPTNYELDQIEFANNVTNDEETAVQANVRREVSWGGNPGFVQFGAKFRQRDKANDEEIEVYDDFGGDFLLEQFRFDGVDYRLDTFGPHVDQAAIRSFFFGNRGSFGLDGDASAIDSTAADFTISEDVFAAYVMAEANIGRWTILGGLRAETTDVKGRGTRTIIDEEFGDGTPAFEPITTSSDYDDIFPSVQVKFQPNDRMIFRGAVTRSLVRPNFAEIAPFQILEIEEDDGEFERNAEVGNPALDPLTATNVDLSFEYYTGGIGLISAGLFYKDIEDFIVLADVAGQGEFIGFDEVIQPLNGDSAEVWGVELAYVQKLDFLPSPWDGFLVSANYTFVDSEADLPFRDEPIQLPRQSENIGNLAIGYERANWSVRAAVSYRDRYLDELTELDDASLDQFVDDHVQYDFTARYFLNDFTQLYFEAINLDNEPLYRFYGRDDFNAQYEEYSWTAQFGVRMFF